jgi:magnesium chelatase family protein
MWSRVSTGGVQGIEPYLIEVEVDLSNGIQAFDIVGLPETSVRESRVRVKSAILNSGFDVPTRRTTVNLAPGDVRKVGSTYDLPIAIGVLASSGQLPAGCLSGVILAGELSLDGALRPGKGTLPLAVLAKQRGITTLIVPMENAREAVIVAGLVVHGANSLSEVVAHLRGDEFLAVVACDESLWNTDSVFDCDMGEVQGQLEAKRAALVAAAGGHNLLLSGSPGCGKTMIARRLHTILPPLTAREALETSLVYSVAGLLTSAGGVLRKRPFRAPHHTSSSAAIIGGGNPVCPGEVSLAHNGVLFLDEFPELERRTLEALRQPLEDGSVVVARAGVRVELPSRIMLVGAMNPCPCGWHGHPLRDCDCSQERIRRYSGRISGPLLDRMDVHVEVPATRYDQLIGNEQQLTSSTMRERVCMARERQMHRSGGRAVWNAALSGETLQRLSSLSATCQSHLRYFVDQKGMSARVYTRVLRIARTIADLDESEGIKETHLMEALSYRLSNEGASL